MSKIKECWQIIERYLRQYAPGAHKTLAPPANDDEVRRLIEEVKFPIPDSLIQSLLVHNGQINNLYAIFDYQQLLSCEGILSNYKKFNKLISNDNSPGDKITLDAKYIKRSCLWNSKWLPITDSDGDALILDFDPSEYGTQGQIFYKPLKDNPPDRSIAKSYEEWMIKLCEKLEDGKFEVDDENIFISNFTYEL